MSYLGWEITHNDSRPVTGTWRAERFGVGMCAGDKALLMRMIDTKVREENAEKEAHHEPQ